MAPDAPPTLPPAAAPAPAKTGSSVLPKVLVGCLAVVVIIGLALSAGLFWLKHKIGDVAKNPAVFAAKMVAAANPDLEIVDQNDSAQTVTIRNKKTGEVVTMNAAEMQKGKIEFSNAKGEKVTLDAGDKDKGGLTVTTGEGTTKIGGAAGDEQLPSWVPAFPGAKPNGVMSSKTATGRNGLVTFATSTPGDKVLDFYEADLKAKGFQIERNDIKNGGAAAMGSLTAKLEGKREVTVTAVPGDKETQVNVNYVER